MSSFYSVNDRVYLRRVTSQFGRIGTSPTGAYYDVETRTQDVFWEHEGADIVSGVRVDEIMGEVEYHDRRRLFIGAMRRPEMRLLRLALLHLHIDQDIDWRAIQSLHMERYGSYNNDCWMLTTDRFITVTLWADKPDIGIYDFSTYWLHNQNDPECKCEMCEETRQFPDGMFFYIENGEGKRLV